MSEGTGMTTPEATVPDGTGAPAAVQTDPGDFDARIRQGGDFALEQVKAAQRELSRIQSEHRDVKPILDAVGGKEALRGHLVRLNTLVSNPAMRSTIEQFERTGQLVAPKANGTVNSAVGDDYEEPWTADLSRNNQEMATLRAELNSLRGERGVEKVQGFLSQFSNSFGLDQSAKEELSAKLIEHANQWGSNEQGLNVLKNLDYTTFRSLALGKLSDDQIESIALRRAQTKSGQRAAAATDVPGRIKTQANEQSADTQMSPKDAFIAACREFGHDPHRPLV